MGEKKTVPGMLNTMLEKKRKEKGNLINKI